VPGGFERRAFGAGSGALSSERQEFCKQLRERLLADSQRVLLRVAMAPDFEHPREFIGTEILKSAETLTAGLSVPKERAVVLILLPHSPELFLLQLGLVLQGHIPAILAWPTNRVDPEMYRRNLVHQLSHLPADQLVTLPRLSGNLAASLPYSVSGVALANESMFDRLFPSEPVGEELAERTTVRGGSSPGEDTLFLQFSGGTTGAQKAIVVTAAMLYPQLKHLGDALQFSPADSVVSWLPLYHDMGLIACYWMPLWYGAASTQMSANDWILNPELFLKYIARYRATLCWLPNFSFSYLAQRRELMRETHDLRSVRVWINCSEPVRHKSVRQFVDSFADWGARRESMQASYAMAETVFAITQSALDKELGTVRRNCVNDANRGGTPLAFDLMDVEYVSSGRPIANAEIKIIAADGSKCSDLTPGEIYVRTPSLFSGYWGMGGFQTHTLNDGWHATGDYGFLARGELFVIGRLKDIVIVGGNNIVPEDVEAVVNTLAGVYPGRVVAFGVDDADYGTQNLGVVAEIKGDYEEERAADLEAVIRKLVLTAIGTAPRYVTVVPERWIVKSTAGKISRRETRQRFVREKMAAS
jgi:fatty-acyl-CoA synthase